MSVTHAGRKRRRAARGEKGVRKAQERERQEERPTNDLQQHLIFFFFFLVLFCSFSFLFYVNSSRAEQRGDPRPIIYHSCVHDLCKKEKKNGVYCCIYVLCLGDGGGSGGVVLTPDRVNGESRLFYRVTGYRRYWTTCTRVFDRVLVLTAPKLPSVAAAPFPWSSFAGTRWVGQQKVLGGGRGRGWRRRDTPPGLYGTSPALRFRLLYIITIMMSAATFASWYGSQN